VKSSVIGKAYTIWSILTGRHPVYLALFLRLSAILDSGLSSLLKNVGPVIVMKIPQEIHGFAEEGRRI
jgi:hypothetical protein